MANTTLRIELARAGFDFATAVISYQEGKPFDSRSAPLSKRNGRALTTTSPELDRLFHNGYEGLNFPRCIAQDALATYVVATPVNGTPAFTRILKDITQYQNNNQPIPYPGDYSLRSPPAQNY